MAKRNPNPVDMHVGNRLRLRRMLVGMSQERLGDQLGLTFQQIQKYEKGTNRVSASRLFQMSQILSVPVQFFFDDMAPEKAGEAEGFAEAKKDFEDIASNFMDQLQSPESLQLIQAFSDIQDSRVRRRLVDLARAIGGAEGNDQDSD